MQMMDLPDPKIANNTDVLIRMKFIGVCGSDVHYCETGQIGLQVEGCLSEYIYEDGVLKTMIDFP
jgi:threonine dehydrogenase-like Zn-dependent dehydrogenase